MFCIKGALAWKISVKVIISFWQHLPAAFVVEAHAALMVGELLFWKREIFFIIAVNAVFSPQRTAHGIREWFGSQQHSEAQPRSGQGGTVTQSFFPKEFQIFLRKKRGKWCGGERGWNIRGDMLYLRLYPHPHHNMEEKPGDHSWNGGLVEPHRYLVYKVFDCLILCLVCFSVMLALPHHNLLSL